MRKYLPTAKVKRGYGQTVLNLWTARGMPPKLAGEMGLRLRPPEC